jgi:hypothetical protein
VVDHPCVPLATSTVRAFERSRGGIRRARVLSMEYQFGNPNRPAVEDEYAKVRAENDWTGEQGRAPMKSYRPVCCEIATASLPKCDTSELQY